MEESRKQLDKLFNNLCELVEESLTEKVGSLYRLNISNNTEQVLAIYLENLLQDEKVKTKLVKQITKNILQEEEKKEKTERKIYKNNLKLWKITKGKIPCIMECGYTNIKTKNEVLNGFNTFICKECVEKAEKENISTFDMVRDKDIYKIFNIE